MPAPLAAVRVPILMLTGEHDPHTPPWHAALGRAGVPDPARVEHEIVGGGGHFAFLSPFPPAMTRPDFPPSQDPPGVDRAALHDVPHERVATFLNGALRGALRGAGVGGAGAMDG